MTRAAASSTRARGPYAMIRAGSCDARLFSVARPPPGSQVLSAPQSANRAAGRPRTAPATIPRNAPGTPRKMRPPARTHRSAVFRGELYDGRVAFGHLFIVYEA